MSSRQTTEPSTVGVEKLQIFRKHPLFGKLAPELLSRLCNLSLIHISEPTRPY